MIAYHKNTNILSKVSEIMKLRVPNYYKKFRCIASACEDTCCAGWDVVIDDETYASYQTMEGPFGERLRSKMVVDQDGDHIFILDGDRCPFLNTSNLCDIHKEKGEAYLSYTCMQFPRYTEEFMGLKEMGISLSCPEAARIILKNDEGIWFEFIEESLDDEFQDDDKDILEVFLQCRETIFHILEMSELPFRVSTAIVLKFVEELQEYIDFGELDELNQVVKKFNKSSYIKGLLKKITSLETEKSVKYKDVQSYFKTYNDLEHINEHDPLRLAKILEMFWKNDEDQDYYLNKHKEFNEKYPETTESFKKILVYFIYRYFMKSFYDYDMSSKTKVAIMSTVMIKELVVARWIENNLFCEADLVEISQSYSKDIEHLVKNIETLETIFESQEVYAVDQIINTLLVEF